MYCNAMQYNVRLYSRFQDMYVVKVKHLLWLSMCVILSLAQSQRSVSLFYHSGQKLELLVCSASSAKSCLLA